MRIFLLFVMIAMAPNLLTALPVKGTTHAVTEPAAVNDTATTPPYRGAIRYRDLKAAAGAILPAEPAPIKEAPSVHLGFLFLFLFSFAVFLLRVTIEVETIASKYRTYWTF